MTNKPRITSDFSKQRISDTDICIFLCISVDICNHSFRRCYTQFGVYPNCTQIKITVKYLLGKRRKNEEKKDTTAQIGTNVRARGFNVGLQARSQFASGRSCNRPTRSRFSVVFLGPRANAE
jgi:hypothetical protein